MFYSQFILAKKGPLGTIWIAAHLERKLRKNQVADTDIGVSVDSILFPEVPIALRLSSHLLLGVVRIYSRKVNYLFDDCSEALLKIKQAFRSTAVDLPPEESTAPYHSITLPETFDLDDFELPDNEIFQGNYVDHHVSTREQITLQDTMEGVVYSTSQFGFDERFGDGDTSQIGLEFDEDLFFGKVATQVNDGISDGDPQTLGQSVTPLEKHDMYDGIPGTSETIQMNGIENQNDVLAASTDFVTYAQAPSTPGLFEEPNLFAVQEPMACSDQLDFEDHNLSNLASMGSSENAGRMSGPRCGDDSTMVSPKENGYHLSDMEIKQTKPQEHELIESISPVLECLNGTVGALDGRNRIEDIHNGIVINNEPLMPFLDQKDAQHAEPAGVRFDETVASPSCSQVTSELDDPARKISSSNSCLRSSEDYLEYQQTCLKPEIQNDVETANNMEQSCIPNITDPFKPVTHEDTASAEVPVLWACGSLPSHRDMLSPADKISEIPFNLPSEVVGPSSLDNATSLDNQLENLDRFATSNLPAPEKLLSVPEGFTSKPSDFLVEPTPEKEVIGGDAGDGDGDGIKLISGKKRSSTESTLTVHSLNSVESFGEARGERTAESIPDDDDLLSSILVGRSSVLKMKPTPPAPELICTKRSRTAARGTASKRKVLMDDTMVLHGDQIRQQLTNTEDIRRVRKKAPCTRPEISMIQRQFLEDAIFTEPIFTGMSVELIYLHTGTFDTSSTRVSENEQNNVSAEPLNDVESFLEPNVTKEIEPLRSTEPVIMRDDSAAQPAGFRIENENQKEEDHNLRSHHTDAQEQGITDLEEFNTSKHEPLGEIAEMEIDKENFEVADPIVEDIYRVSADVNVQSRLMDKTDDEDVLLQMDALCRSPNNKLDTQPMEVDALIVEASIQKEVDAIEVVDHNVEIRADVRIGASELTDNVNVTLSTGESKNLSFSDYQPVEGIGNSEKHIVNETEVLEANLHCDDNASLNGKESLGFREVDPQSGIDAVVAAVAEDRGDCEDVGFGNDTEFLNVDDDEITEYVDDMPCAEDTRLLENSGWSSRTRAVAKYLQTLLDKEPAHGKKVLGMDSLLNGKTRKEASRMFFETLVLKTRDYIHVEQAKPFDNVSIRSRVKLMKSEF
ncbi:sister chromatid cohesion 1 protein 4-like [Pyrus communis]|uniref:sister chromatid cohesion 1 protein 4-like n=1 Tax=Pyrus communis TaxID=23211 RepID=UPI0035C0412A